jgi:hypothetical protein
MREALVFATMIALCSCGTRTNEAAAAPLKSVPSDAGNDAGGGGSQSGSSSSSPSPNGVCIRIATHSVCDEMVGTLYAGVDHAKLCRGDTWAATCPTDHRLGACQLSAGTAGEWISNYYSDGPNKYDAAKAQDICKKARGNWKP